MSNWRKIGKGVLITVIGAGVTEVPFVYLLGYLIMLPGLYVFMGGFNGLLNTAKIGKNSRG